MKRLFFPCFSLCFFVLWGGGLYGPNNNYEPMSQRKRNRVGAETWKERGEWARSNGTKDKGQELEMSKIT